MTDDGPPPLISANILYQFIFYVKVCYSALLSYDSWMIPYCHFYSFSFGVYCRSRHNHIIGEEGSHSL